jgi:hypothetical protein
MPPRHDHATPVEILRAQVLMTETGYPAPLELVEGAYGKRVHPAPEPGWFWIGATPEAAERIRRRGLHAVGTLTTSFIPPQTAGEIDRTVTRESVPIVGTQAHTDLMLAETRERRATQEGDSS